MLWLRLFTTSYFAIMCFSEWPLLSKFSAAFVSFRWARAIRRLRVDDNRDEDFSLSSQSIEHDLIAIAAAKLDSSLSAILIRA